MSSVSVGGEGRRGRCLAYKIETSGSSRTALRPAVAVLRLRTYIRLSRDVCDGHRAPSQSENAGGFRVEGK